MHPEIVALNALWEVDGEMEQIRQYVEELANRVREATVGVALVEEEIRALQVQVDTNGEQTREVTKKREYYTRKRNQTRSLIDQGKAPDFFVAEKQYKQCRTMVDELEYEELELMEELEELAIHGRALQQRLAERHQQVKDASTRQSEIRPKKAQRYKELQPQKAQCRTELPRHLHGSYDRLRERERVPLVRLLGDICSHCNISAPPQMVIEILSGKRLTSCRGCGAWLLPPLEPEDDVG